MVFDARWKSRNNSTHSSHTAFLFTKGKVAISNRYVRNAFLYVVAHGCKWRALPQRFINWHTIDTRISRRSKAGVRDRIVAALQQAHILRLRSEAVSLDATVSKVHPDGTGALKKMANNR